METEAGVQLSVPAAPASHRTIYLNYEDGYDSNNEIGLFWDAVEGEEEEEDDDDSIFCFGVQFSEPQTEVNNIDDTAPAANAETANASAANAETANTSATNLTINQTEEELKKMSNDALRNLCKEKKLSTNGNKTQLVARLLANPNGRVPPTIINTGTMDKEKVEAPLTGFHPDAKWRR